MGVLVQTVTHKPDVTGGCYCCVTVAWHNDQSMVAYDRYSISFTISDVSSKQTTKNTGCCYLFIPPYCSCIKLIVPAIKHKLKRAFRQSQNASVIKMFEDYSKKSWWRHQMETFPRNWPFVRGIHRGPVNSPHKGRWRGALMFTLICARVNGWVNNGKAGDLIRYRAHYDVIVMWCRVANAQNYIARTSDFIAHKRPLCPFVAFS